MGGVPNGIMGAMAQNQSSGGMMAGSMKNPVEPLWETRQRFNRLIFFSLAGFLIPLAIGVSWYYIKHPRIVNVTDNYVEPQKAATVPRNEHGDKIGRLVVVHGASKVVFDNGPSLLEMPENEKLKDTVFFTKDGTAVLINVNSEYKGEGGDTVWRSNGQWFAILNEYHKEITEKDFRFMGYETPEDCGKECVPVMVKK